jgi:hypothetical protein
LKFDAITILAGFGMLACASVLGRRVWLAHKLGRWSFVGKPIERAARPKLYWAVTAFNLVLALACLVAAAMVVFDASRT